MEGEDRALEVAGALQRGGFPAQGIERRMTVARDHAAGPAVGRQADRRPGRVQLAARLPRRGPEAAVGVLGPLEVGRRPPAGRGGRGRRQRPAADPPSAGTRTSAASSSPTAGALQLTCIRERTRSSILSRIAPKARPKPKLATTWVTSNTAAEPSTTP